MVKITCIKKLNSFGFFESFDWPTGGELELFDKNNLVYGFNGSGKTNLSRVFSVLETQKPRTDAGYNRASFTLDTDIQGTRITESNLESAPCVRVFNKDFIKGHIQIEQGLTNSFFHLIKLDPDDRKKLNALYATKQKLTDGRTLKREEKEAVAEEKSKILATTRAIIKETLSGTGPYFTNYDVKKLEQRINDVNSGDVAAKVLATAKLKSEKATVNSVDPPDEIGAIQSTPSGLDVLDKEIASLLKRTVTVTRIKEFADEKLNTWAEIGYSIHTTANASDCFYCTNMISASRKKALSEHFSEEYMEYIKELDAYTVQLSTKHLAPLNLSARNFIHDLQNEAQIAITTRNELNERFEEAIEEATSKLKSKRAKLSKKEAIVANFSKINKAYRASQKELESLVSRHNTAVRNYKNTRKEAANSIELHYASEINKKVAGFNAKTKLIDQCIVDKYDKRLDANSASIDQLEKKTSDDGPAIEEININIAAILGRSDIKLHKKDDVSFEIRRKGKKAESLSEGEQTAIAFAYYCAKLQEKGVLLKDKILVIDDPISSLDHHRLYAVASKVQEIAPKAMQVFLLTHNYEFFRELRKAWARKDEARVENGKLKESSFYFIEAGFNEATSSRFPRLINLPKLLMKYDSDYHYNFSQLYDFSQNADIEKAYVMPNITRKFLETFLSFKSPGAVGLAGLSAICEPADQATITRFLNFSNHADYVDRLSQLDHTTVSGAQDVVKLVLAVAGGESGDPDHIKKLVKMCS